MPAERSPNPVLATLAAAGGLVLLVMNRGSTGAHPARAAAQRPAGPSRPHAAGGHGHEATSPADFPARGWWEILKRTASEVNNDRVMTEAAGITFYTLLALFPALAALISIYGLFADPATINEHLQAVADVIPSGGMQIIDEQVRRITSKGSGTLGFGAVLGLATSLWSANQAMKAFVDSLNIVYGEKEKRSFFKRLAVTMAFTVAGILFIVLAMVGVVAIPVVLNFVGLGGTLDSVLRLARWPVLLIAVGFFLACLYRYGPSRERAQWRWVSWGSAFASLAWVAFSLGFSWYVTHFGSYNETYGSLGAVIGFMTWIWLSSTVVLAGAELDAEMEHQTARDTTTGPERPLGARGARMADTVAG
ncbi:YihY/virulence factor BrkB family protein [Paracraurococcus lichenis]|uniref:YihY/virulence factor BrkB family protein n=1 Tax=Paracraurococcus lichenis TaxID=3064888 RepID=A0ABT9DWR7_9PROT|nr:YihY/virulence factor BrkB family protein [Paracraurococcus sp. LOR1-02]MDO9708347.1 YihY/virulence factor BrkB family protein [Paracraurococcus sp. LOR1-02]